MTKAEKKAARASQRALLAYQAGFLCGRRGERVREAAEVVRAIRRRYWYRRLGKAVVPAFWNGWKEGRHHA
jgi:hypothetical protein